MSLYLVERVLPGITMQQFGAFAAYNNFRKVLHLARHVLEPDLPPKGTSAYLPLPPDILTLDPDRAWIDFDPVEGRG